jgi:hypothetical protein
MRIRAFLVTTLAVAALLAWGCAETEQEAESHAGHTASMHEMAAATPDTAAILYVCAHHATQTHTKPGICGVEGCTGLLAMKDAPEGTTYVCPMHADATSDKPGRCGACNMFLHAKPPASPPPAG